jgi:hypothetical protein
MSLLAGFDNPRITTKLFPRSSHALKKAFNPAKYPDIDWPRRVDASYEVVAQWIGHNILGRQPRQRPARESTGHPPVTPNGSFGAGVAR